MKVRCAVYTVVNPDVKQEPQFEVELAKQLVDTLKHIAKEMECGLEDWKKKVEGSRKGHYELNYYTTLQLLGLRKELALIRSKSGKQCSPEVLALLQSISPNLTFEDVHDAVMPLQESSSSTELIPKYSPTVTMEELSDGAKNLGQFSSTSVSPTKDQNGQYTSDQNSPATIPLSSESYNSMPCEAADEHMLTRPAALKEEDLKAQQKDIFTDLVGYQGYSKELVLKALEISPSEADIYDIQHWCDENQNKFHPNTSSAKQETVENKSLTAVLSQSDAESEDSSDDESSSMDIFSLDSRAQPQGLYI